MEHVSYGIIGFGGIAENRIAAEGFEVRAGGEAEVGPAALVGCTDVNPDRAEAARALGLKWYESADDLLTDESIEAVFIATNNRTHAPLAERAIRAGKHCLIEKPIATDLESARRLQRLAAENGVSIAVDHMMTENAYNIEARRLIDQGTIGDVNDIVLHMEFSFGATPQEAATWRCADRAELGGPIGDVASHCFYIAEFLLRSPIRSLSCVYTPRTMDIAVENGALIQMTLENGVTGTVRVAFNQPRGGLAGTISNLGYEVYGAEGAIRSYGTMFQLSGLEGEPIRLRLEVDDGILPKEVEVHGTRSIYRAVIEAHAASILSGRHLDAADGVRNLELILACHESATDGGNPIQV
jgi:predicted dehydrogenase